MAHSTVARDPHGTGSPLSDLVLIYPYFYTHAPKAMLFHPQGIAQLAAVLRRAGISVRVVDCTFQQRDEVLVAIETIQPKIVGISIMVSMSQQALDLAREIHRRLPETLLACGGPLSTLRPQQFAQAFDLVFCGEAVQAFLSFCRAYLQAGAAAANLPVLLRHAEAYPGLYYQPADDGAAIRISPQSSDEMALNHLPLPDRSDYDHARYQQFWLEREDYALAGIMMTYGCPYQCDFCSKPIFGSRFRRRSLDRIVAEIRDIKRWDYTGLWIADDCLTLDREHLRNFCQRLIAEKLDMRWWCLSRVDRMTAREIDLMQRAGCQKVFFGLESGSNDVLRLMNKQITTDMAEQTLKLFARSDIRTAGFFMVGYPGETYETIETTFQWALTLPLDDISFTIPYPLPGTGLFEKVFNVQAEGDWQYENENRLTYQSEFDEEYLRTRIAEVSAQFNARCQGKTETPAETRSMNLTLSLSDTLSLIHAPVIGAGKTAAMAKGLFLCYRDEIYAGEAAGFGVPVWKTGRHTVFPALVSAQLLNPTTLEKIYRLNRVVTWQILGINAPDLFAAAMEGITAIYMRHPCRQQICLRIRNALLALFRIRNAMVPGSNQGECRVRYTTDAQRLIVTVDGSALQGQGELILLNEAAGLAFTRWRSGQHIYEGDDIPAWQDCPFDTVIENPTRNLGFSVSIPAKEVSSHWRLTGGREVARELNWTGMALTTDQRVFSYTINFFSPYYV